MSRSNINPRKEEIVVFAFKKGSQTKLQSYDKDSYRFVEDCFEKLMSGHNIECSKIGLSGYREDMVNYLASLIDIYVKYDTILKSV
jgi:hypothetical protein